MLWAHGGESDILYLFYLQTFPIQILYSQSEKLSSTPKPPVNLWTNWTEQIEKKSYGKQYFISQRNTNNTINWLA